MFHSSKGERNMRYIRTKDGHIFEIVDYEQLDENTKKNVRQLRYGGLEDYLNEPVFVKIHKNMPNPISQFQSIKMFNILKQADTIEELCDEFVVINENGKYEGSSEILDICFLNFFTTLKDKKKKLFGAVWTDKGLIYVAKMNEKGELELL